MAVILRIIIRRSRPKMILSGFFLLLTHRLFTQPSRIYRSTWWCQRTRHSTWLNQHTRSSTWLNQRTRSTLYTLHSTLQPRLRRPCCWRFCKMRQRPSLQRLQESKIPSSWLKLDTKINYLPQLKLRSQIYQLSQTLQNKIDFFYHAYLFILQMDNTPRPVPARPGIHNGSSRPPHKPA